MESTVLEKKEVEVKIKAQPNKINNMMQNPIENIESPIINIDQLSVSYGGDKYSINDVSAGIAKNKITAIMGPSGCGKSTLLRAINRMHELNPDTHNKGTVYLGEEDIYKMNPILLRRKIGMVFQRPNPFPTMSIYDNVIAGYLLNGIKLKRREKDEIVEKSLREVGLWSEVKDSLHNKGTFLSGGQQQRLCIARALAYTPEIILLDEPTSALDPIATAKIEDLLVKLKKDFTIVLVTHNMSQAARISDYSMFMYLGELVEYGKTKQMFTMPKDKRTEEYLTGKFG
ncbi:phosphate ABC transporter ATP-binding protein PstB [Labilibaculum sp. K2S]|uniref:phosphate ABC transporter ATP-binding protein PstB n=1 Tax=Labilibaculum sp. K2S TaxID=3056386 RepID=UPI0025A44CE5|nr:phosphate ABC transporter ATP-binding protein PstB [Labilibaculum sp. K2S]MDM8158311.1 phosphate ABC transporter ATP-binding protein PstB [Labilibaculum sp. K2S]